MQRRDEDEYVESNKRDEDEYVESNKRDEDEYVESESNKRSKYLDSVKRGDPDWWRSRSIVYWFLAPTRG